MVKMTSLIPETIMKAHDFDEEVFLGSKNSQPLDLLVSLQTIQQQ